MASLSRSEAIFCLKGGEIMPNKQNIAAVEDAARKASRVAAYAGRRVPRPFGRRYERAARGAAADQRRNDRRQEHLDQDRGERSRDQRAGRVPGRPGHARRSPTAIRWRQPRHSTIICATCAQLDDRCAVACIGAQQIEGADLERVASTPSREQSIAKIMGGINAPATRIATALERRRAQHRLYPGTGCRRQGHGRRGRSAEA